MATQKPNIADRFDYYDGVILADNQSGSTFADYAEYYTAEDFLGPAATSEATLNRSEALPNDRVSFEPEDWNSKDFFIATVSGKLWLIPLAILAGIVVGVVFWLLWVSLLKVSVGSGKKAKKLLRSHKRSMLVSEHAKKHMSYKSDFPVTLVNHFPVGDIMSTPIRSRRLTNQDITLAIDNMELAMDNVIRDIQSSTLSKKRTPDAPTGKNLDLTCSSSSSPGVGSKWSSSSSSVISVKSIVHREDNDGDPILSTSPIDVTRL